MNTNVLERHWIAIVSSIVAIASILAGFLPAAPIFAAIGTALCWRSRWKSTIFLFSAVVLAISLVFLLIYVDTNLGGSSISDSGGN
jgi:hypothetical protein